MNRGRGHGRGRGRGRDRGRDRGSSPGRGEYSGSSGGSSGRSSHPYRPVGASGSPFDEKSSSSRDATSLNSGRNSQPNSRGWFSRHPNSGIPPDNIYAPKEALEDGLSTSDHVHKPNKSLKESISSTGRILHDQTAPNCSSIWSIQSDRSAASNSLNEGDSALMPPIAGSRDLQSDFSHKLNIVPLQNRNDPGLSFQADFSFKLNIVPLQNQNDPSLSFQASANYQLSQEKHPNNVASGGDLGRSEQQAVDICLSRTGTPFKLKSSLFAKNREKHDGVNEPVLRPGMVLVKNYLSRQEQVGASGSSFDEKRSSSRDATLLNSGRNSQPNSPGWFSRHPNSGIPPGNTYAPKEPLEDRLSTSDHLHKPNKSLKESMSSTGRFLHYQSASNCSSIGSNQSDCSVASNSVNEGDSALMPPIAGSRDVHSDFSHKLNIGTLQNQNDSRLSFQAGANDQLSQEKHPNNVAYGGDSGRSEQQAVVQPFDMEPPFDICLPKTGTPFKLKPSLFAKNREKRNEVRHAGVNEVLRPGMVLLKNYLSRQEQINIVKLCRDIGMGPGGFYQPVYHDGGRMHLKMMSLGKSWDPDRGEYVEHRPFDGAKAPIFPRDFHPLVDRAIKDSQALIERNCKSTTACDILPSLSPNICVVNFYSESGRLGLHQDKDESPDSLRRGLPVVSFSIGDVGEFLFGDQRDVGKADKVLLESGDVLIFGGKSRHIFHGVSSVKPKTAPEFLLDETNLRPGRLNLTFRQY